MKMILILTTLVAAATVATQAADVKENWEKNCAKCHGPDGKGDTKMGKKAEVKDMTSADYQASLKDDVAFKHLKEGMKNGDKVQMKPFSTLSDDEIKALVAHVRTLKK
jgi:cytochrome c553